MGKLMTGDRTADRVIAELFLLAAHWDVRGESGRADVLRDALAEIAARRKPSEVGSPSTETRLSDGT